MLSWGIHNEALRCCTEAMELLRGLGDRYNEARTLNSLGYIHHQLGHFGLAIRNYRVTGDSGAAKQAWNKALNTFEMQHHPDAEQVRAKLTGFFQEASGPTGPLVING